MFVGIFDTIFNNIIICMICCHRGKGPKEKVWKLSRLFPKLFFIGGVSPYIALALRRYDLTLRGKNVLLVSGVLLFSLALTLPA